MAREKCKGSGTVQRLSWFPEPNAVPPYPGAVVCITCSLGIKVLKRGVFKDAEGMLCGTVRSHYPPPPERPTSWRSR